MLKLLIIPEMGLLLLNQLITLNNTLQRWFCRLSAIWHARFGLGNLASVAYPGGGAGGRSPLQKVDGCRSCNWGGRN